MRDSLESVLPRVLHLLASGGLATAVVLATLWLVSDRRTSHAESPATLAPTARANSAAADGEVPSAEGLSKTFRRAAQKVLPAVVVIKAGSSPVCPRCGRAHGANDDNSDEEGSEAERQRSLDVLGSGFIVDPSGVVLTNKHVVKGNPRLVVQTADGKQFPVREVSTDRQYDAAVLRIQANAPLPFVRLGDSEAAEIGDWVLTIGCPLELDQTVSAGIVSAKNRSLCPTHQAKYLQTDAVINPGSSGGPLVALNGTVIGITTAIASEDGGYQGIGFAIPANLVKRLVTRFTAGPNTEWGPVDPGEK